MMMAIAHLQERIELGLGSVGQRIPDILSDPRAYPREAMLLLAIASVAILLLALFAILVLDVAQAVRARRELGVRKRRERTWLAVAVSSGAVFVVLFLITLVPMSSVSGRACGACHAVRGEVESWSRSAHGKVSCYACHAQSGAFGAFEAASTAVVSFVFGSGRGAPNSRACFDCHAGIARRTMERRGVKVRHAEMIEAGLDCLVCHPGVGHSASSTSSADPRPSALMGSRPTSERSRMSVCVRCHDGSSAPSGCPTCHTANFLDVARSEWQPGTLATRLTCKGCHKERTERRCIECHGLELPHPASFLGQHARMSSKNPSLCHKCHESASTTKACDCHPDGQIHGNVSVWFQEHGRAAGNIWPGGCRCHDDSMCGKCHEAHPMKAR